MNELTRNKREERLFKVAVVAVGALFIVGLYLLFPQVFAEDDQGNTATIIKLIVKRVFGHKKWPACGRSYD